MTQTPSPTATPAPACAPAAPWGFVPRSFVIVRGGPAPSRAAAAKVAVSAAGPPYVVAVDLGFAHSRALGLHVDLVVGDLDSLDAASADELRRDPAAPLVIEYPVDKDATDLELALELVASLAGADRRVDGGVPVPVSVLGGAGWDDRFDHLAAQIGLLASPRWRALAVTAYLGSARVRPVHGGQRVPVDAPVGAVVSLLPIGGAALDVATTGLRFPLHGETLDPFATRGVSNVVASPDAEVGVGHGVVLVVVPHDLEPRDIEPHDLEPAYPGNPTPSPQSGAPA